jgi:uncharacterized protein YndB with AHSA1/START domain
VTDDDAIVHEVVYAHPPRRVWRALTDSAALADWLMPNDFLPRVGHRFTFRAEPQPGFSGIVRCEVLELSEPKRIAWSWQGDPPMPVTTVTFTLEPVGEGTRLRLEHAGFAAGGELSLTIRDILDQGWGSKLLREALPASLGRMAAAEAGGERG